MTGKGANSVGMAIVINDSIFLSIWPIFYSPPGAAILNSNVPVSVLGSTLRLDLSTSI